MEKIVLGLPGISWPRPAFQAVLGATREHWEHFQPIFSDMPAHNFNNCWATALNMAEAGQATKFVMLHSDCFPDLWWIDTLVKEMNRGKYAVLSVAIAIKDIRGILSCGIGDPANPQVPKKRFTVRESNEFPETWTAEDAGHPGEMLLHNNGCWIADLTDTRFFETDSQGNLKCMFDFPCRIYRNSVGFWVTDGESEDWYFSRRLWEVGIRNTAITRKIRLVHRGSLDFPNYVMDEKHPGIQWFKKDWNTETKWNKDHVSVG